MSSSFTCATGFFYILFDMIHKSSFALCNYEYTMHNQILYIVSKYSYKFEPMRMSCESFSCAENQNISWLQVGNQLPSAGTR